MNQYTLNTNVMHDFAELNVKIVNLLNKTLKESTNEKSFSFQLKTRQNKSAKIIFLRLDGENTAKKTVSIKRWKNTNVDVFNSQQLDFHRIIGYETHHSISQKQKQSSAIQN